MNMIIMRQSIGMEKMMKTNRRENDFKLAIKLIKEIAREDNPYGDDEVDMYFRIVNKCQDFLEQKGIPWEK